MGMPHQYSGSNFPVLSVNLIPVPLSNLPVHAPTTFSHYVNSPLWPTLTPSLFYSRLKTYSQTFPTIDCLPASGLTPRTITDRFFWAPGFKKFFSLLFFSFGSVQKIKLAIRRLLGTRKYSACIVSYRISQSHIHFGDWLWSLPEMIRRQLMLRDVQHLGS